MFLRTVNKATSCGQTSSIFGIQTIRRGQTVRVKCLPSASNNQRPSSRHKANHWWPKQVKKSDWQVEIEAGSQRAWTSSKITTIIIKKWWRVWRWTWRDNWWN